MGEAEGGAVRIRVGAAMAEKGGRSGLVGVEVRRAPGKKREWHFRVGAVQRPVGTVEDTAAAVLEATDALADLRPCVIVDAGTPQGFALRRRLREKLPKRLHRPHAYPRTRGETQLFAQFLEAYSAGRVRFEDGLDHRKELDQALVFYMAGKDSEVKLKSEDEALVVALALALAWPGHGLGEAELAVVG